MGTLTKPVLDGALLDVGSFYGGRVLCVPRAQSQRGRVGQVQSAGGGGGNGGGRATPLGGLSTAPGGPGSFFHWDQEASSAARSITWGGTLVTSWCGPIICKMRGLG